MADSEPGGGSGRGGRLTDRIGLGVLTRLVHRDLVDEVLIDTGKVERRRRALPARVVVYFVLAMTLFFEDAYEEVMRKLVEGLRFLRSWDDDWQVPTSSALCQARARLGSAPLRELYERVARPLASAGTPGAWLGDLRIMAIDGVQLDVPDSPDNDAEFGRGASKGLDAPYPKVKVLGLGECGTHAVIDAHLGGVLVDERDLVRPLLASFESDMLVLADRGFYSHQLWQEAAATGAQLLWRVQSGLLLHPVTELSDGSYLSVLLTTSERQRLRRQQARGLATVPHGPTVRVIEYDITNRDTNDGSPIRLITTLLEPEQASATELAAVYHQRWEFESSLAEIETRQRGSYRVLRSHSPDMVRQEIWALLLTHYAIRALIVEATDPDGLDPLRMSFIRTLRIVRRHVTGQAGFSP
ncbi:IS4 family transposase [Mycolicibacterium fortuitum]|uniref:IS4 family transposase n=1 Tax=Mycolicibacterium fortuitum TaxID=1766 RepID=UPI0034CE6A3A